MGTTEGREEPTTYTHKHNRKPAATRNINGAPIREQRWIKQGGLLPCPAGVLRRWPLRWKLKDPAGRGGAWGGRHSRRKERQGGTRHTQCDRRVTSCKGGRSRADRRLVRGD